MSSSFCARQFNLLAPGFFFEKIEVFKSNVEGEFYFFHKDSKKDKNSLASITENNTYRIQRKNGKSDYTGIH